MLRSKFVSIKPIIRGQCIQRLSCSSPPSATDEEKERELEKIAKDASIDEPPTACCQSGCSNCVFIVWAEALTNKMDNAGPEIAEKILKLVEDPSMKAYLEMELRIRGLKNKNSMLKKIAFVNGSVVLNHYFLPILVQRSV